MTTLTEFLTARLDEDEATARAATPGPWEWDGFDREYRSRVSQRVTTGTELGDEVGSAGDRDARHIIRHNPARVLREVEAKRAILALDLPPVSCDHAHPQYDVYHPDGHGPHPVYLAMAQAHSDHPDFDPNWSTT